MPKLLSVLATLFRVRLCVCVYIRVEARGGLQTAFSIALPVSFSDRVCPWNLLIHLGSWPARPTPPVFTSPALCISCNVVRQGLKLPWLGLESLCSEG